MDDPTLPDDSDESEAPDYEVNDATPVEPDTDEEVDDGK